MEVWVAKPDAAHRRNGFCRLAICAESECYFSVARRPRPAAATERDHHRSVSVQRILSCNHQPVGDPTLGLRLGGAGLTRSGARPHTGRPRCCLCPWRRCARRRGGTISPMRNGASPASCSVRMTVSASALGDDHHHADAAVERLQHLGVGEAAGLAPASRTPAAPRMTPGRCAPPPSPAARAAGSRRDRRR